MTNESLTLFIPLYGKAMMSREGFLADETAEKIVSEVDFDFAKVDRSRKLAIYMAMRAALYDGYVRDFAAEHPDGLILQLGVGLDSRVRRVPVSNPWYDLDFPEVIALRRTYFPEDDRYHLIGAPALPVTWLADIPKAAHALVLAEGLSMYLSEGDMRVLMAALQAHFGHTTFIFDAYSRSAAKLSALKNPVNAVKARIDFAMDAPETLLTDTQGMRCAYATGIITLEAIDRLKGTDRLRFRFMGCFGNGFYRIFGYELEGKAE
ncbi:MAG: class I SAM-dependent methyltransferase [Clostridia bacterium]|nr:class I SAM-dependent methyltransferase [Clostridia bacterium]